MWGEPVPIESKIGLGLGEESPSRQLVRIGKAEGRKSSAPFFSHFSFFVKRPLIPNQASKTSCEGDVSSLYKHMTSQMDNKGKKGNGYRGIAVLYSIHEFKTVTAATRLARHLLLGCGLAGSLSAVTASQIELSWQDESDNEHGFSIERSIDGAGFEEISTTEANLARFVDSGVQAGNLYEYRVRAYNQFGYSGYSNTVLAEVVEDVASEEGVELVNQLSNGDFADGKADWRFYTSGMGTYRILPGEEGQTGKTVQVEIYSRANNIQLFQNGITLEGDTEYEIHFDAYSNSGHDLRVSVAKHSSPYTNYGVRREIVDLGTDWQRHTIRFRSENIGSSVSNARLFFWFADDATGGDRYLIRNVILAKAGQVVSPDPIPDSTLLTEEGDAIVLDPTDNLGDAVDVIVDGEGGLLDQVDQLTDEQLAGLLEQLAGGSPGDNVLKNGGFESGMDDWRFYSNSKCDATIVQSAGSGSAVEVAIHRVGSNIQLYQNGITLKPNTAYQLSFSAYSNVGRDLSVSLNKHSTPFTNYGLQNVQIDLGKDWDTYTVTFTTRNFDRQVSDGRLYFWFADRIWGGERFYIDDVVLTPLGGSEGPEAPTGVQAQRIDSTKVDLTWSPVTVESGLVGYLIYRDGVDIGYSLTSSFSDSDAAGLHVYTVTAFDESPHESAPSAPVEVQR